MKARGLVWLGRRTRNFDDTVRFFGDTLGLRKSYEEPDFTGFLVDDVREARADLEAAGISFLGPVHESDDGAAWSHFRGPDGNVYEITTPA